MATTLQRKEYFGVAITANFNFFISTTTTPVLNEFAFNFFVAVIVGGWCLYLGCVPIL